MRALREWAPAYRRDAWAGALAAQDVDDNALAAELGERFALERRGRHHTFADNAGALDALAAHPMAVVTNGALLGADEAIMIGDSLDRDISGALA